ncbi:MAG: DUF2079 domain-containing protein [Candidatus Levybacteria bacterium]|nr:DUF2079 domain-containing protein [Candidatus Levybacteria bacterium]
MGKVLPKNLKKYAHEIILAILTISYLSYFTYATFLRYENFYAGKFDLGNMVQTVWNSAHGNIFMLTDPNATREVSRLAFHSDFILVLFAPFYLIWEDPRTLLLIQTIVLSFGGLFVYLISNHVLKNKNISLVFALSYFLSPAVHFTNLFDFHSVTLATTFFLCAFYFMFKKNWRSMLIFLILAAITKEQIWLITGLVGIYLFFAHKKKMLGTFITLSSFFIFYLLIWHLMPQNLGKQHFAIPYYSSFGDSPLEIAANIFLEPQKTIKTLLMPDRILFIKQLFIPLGYLSFFAPLFLIFAGPDLVINLLSASNPLHQIYYQYSAAITPFIFISAIFGIKFLKSKIPQISYNAFGAMIIIFSIISAYDYGPLPYSRHPSLKTYKRALPEKMEIYSYISLLTPDEKIAATNNIGAQLSQRRHVYVIPRGLDIADKAIFLTSRSMNSGEKAAFEKIKSDPDFIPIFKSGGFYVFKRINR